MSAHRSRWRKKLREIKKVAIYKAPWKISEIANLLDRQRNSDLHPYTCGNDSRHPVLIPTQNGWICLGCDYKQDWCFEIDAISMRWWERGR